MNLAAAAVNKRDVRRMMRGELLVVPVCLCRKQPNVRILPEADSQRACLSEHPLNGSANRTMEACVRYAHITYRSSPTSGAVAAFRQYACERA